MSPLSAPLRIWLLILTIGASFLVPPLPIPVAVVHAETSIAPIQPQGGVIAPYTGPCSQGVSGTCHSEESFIGGIFSKVLQIALLLAGILATLFIVYNGIQYILSAGDAAKMKAARANILNILLGIIIIVAVYSIIRFAQTLGGLANGL